ncbi:MAG: peptidyl-prolyl cis-trans isomerase [Hyphomonadaceae bacterium]
MATPKRAFIKAVLVAGALSLAGCGLGRDSGSDAEGRADPIVAATVNGRPIYIEDVRTYAVTQGWLAPTEDLDADSTQFDAALDALIQARLFALEAEAKGHDRRVDIRRQIENAREWVLADSIYDEIDVNATNPEAVERLYQDYVNRSGQSEEVHLRHIVFPTREAADQAKRRLDQGERFEVIAFEQNTSGDGGDLGFRSVDDLTTMMRQEVQSTTIGGLIGPVQLEEQWYIYQVMDRRARGVASLETLRPRIVAWLRYQGAVQLEERLARDARIERFRQRQDEIEPSGEVTAPGDAEPVRPTTPQPDANAPPFPFPMGPGAATGAQTPNPAPRAQTEAAPPANPLPAPAEDVRGPEG